LPNSTPVTIAFDEKSPRINLLTDQKLPNYTQAKRGSIQFFLDRLDTPDGHFNFFHDGIQQARIESLHLIEKVQEQFDVWRIRYKNGGKNSPRIHHKAVSFIPLNPATNLPESRVHVLLEELQRIDWGTE